MSAQELVFPAATADSRAKSLDHPARRTPVPRIGSEKLLLGAHELVIEHAGQEYHLRLTRNDKLILTK
jgi:hemin uptake protein HemP